MTTLFKYLGYFFLFLGVASGVSLFLFSILDKDLKDRSVATLWALFFIGIIAGVLIFGKIIFGWSLN